MDPKTNVRQIVSLFENNLLPITNPKESNLRRTKSMPISKNSKQNYYYQQADNINGTQDTSDLLEQNTNKKLITIKKELFEMRNTLDNYRIYSRDAQIQFHDQLYSFLYDLIPVDEEDDTVNELIHSVKKMIQKLHSVLPTHTAIQKVPNDQDKDQKVIRHHISPKKITINNNSNNNGNSGLGIFKEQISPPNNRIAYRALLGRHKSLETVNNFGREGADDEDVVTVCRNINIHDLKAKFEMGSQGNTLFVPLPKPIFKRLTGAKSMETLRYFGQNKNQPDSPKSETEAEIEAETETEAETVNNIETEIAVETGEDVVQHEEEPPQEIEDEFESLVSELDHDEDYVNGTYELAEENGFGANDEEEDGLSTAESGEPSDIQNDEGELRVLNLLKGLKSDYKSKRSFSEGPTNV